MGRPLTGGRAGSTGLRGLGASPLGAAVGAGTSACRNASAWARALAAASSSALAIIC